MCCCGSKEHDSSNATSTSFENYRVYIELNIMNWKTLIFVVVHFIGVPVVVRLVMWWLAVMVSREERVCQVYVSVCVDKSDV